jgi:signal transduction histidine kinase
LKQVLVNLVDNALNYTAAGGEITVEAQVADGYLNFHVIDNGIGISSGDQEKLFSRFFRGDDPLVQAHSGTGMGLFVVKSIVELHGGEIWLDSKPGEGSRFSFSLPVVDQQAEDEPEKEFKTISYRAQDLAAC